ncbi:MAG: alpha/beta hydrolase [Geothermobacteraceae bacterium]
MFGQANGCPVIYQHGLPGSRLEAGLVAAAAERLGIQLIAADRPGYGGSDPEPGRSLTGWAADVTAVADHFELNRFALLGVSGGALYALAAAAGLGARVSGVGIVCGLAPMALPQLAVAMPVPARLLFSAMASAPQLAASLLRTLACPLLARLPGLVFRLLAPTMPVVDRETLGRPDVRNLMTAVIREAFAGGGAGPVQDLLLLGGPLDFDLRGVTTPVTLWYGDADRTVPLEHGRWLADHLPDARLQVCEGEGHFSLPVRQADSILRELKGMLEAES